MSEAHRDYAVLDGVWQETEWQAGMGSGKVLYFLHFVFFSRKSFARFTRSLDSLRGHGQCILHLPALLSKHGVLSVVSASGSVFSRGANASDVRFDPPCTSGLRPAGASSLSTVDFASEPGGELR